MTATGGTGQHRLEVEDRGRTYKHRFQPECTCGWWAGIPSTTRRAAALQYREHRNVQHHPARDRGPAALTPRADLPEELR